MYRLANLHSLANAGNIRRIADARLLRELLRSAGIALGDEVIQDDPVDVTAVETVIIAGIY